MNARSSRPIHGHRPAHPARHALRPIALAVVVVASTACFDGDARSAYAAPADADAYAAVEVIDAHGVSMGSVAFPVSCGAQAEPLMRLGLALLHNMTYVEAERTFAGAAEADPGCALAYWGQAMSYLHPLWPDVPSAEHLDRGWALLQEARAAGAPTAREAAYLDALDAYYRDATSRTEPARLADYAAAWDRVRADHPEDPEAELFAALAMIATDTGADGAFARRAAAGAMAERVLERIPDHPGAHHYVIHAFDVATLAERALPVARSYGLVAPENSHALHMTSHIFTREGLWEESIDYNSRAADVALDEPISGQTSHHHLHAVDYLAYAHLQRGADELAEDVLDHLYSLEGPVVNHAVSAYALAAVPARLAVERRRWSDAAALEARRPSTIPWDAYPHLEAIPVFVRALGGARQGDLPAARAAAARLSELRAAAAELPGAYDWGVQVEVQEIGARAWIAFAEGRADDAVALMTRATGLEARTEKSPVTPAEVQPAGELLGDMLLEIGRDVEALDAYAAALERNRNRFNSLMGAGRAAERLGDRATATAYYAKLLEMAGGSRTRRGELDRVEAYLGR